MRQLIRIASAALAFIGSPVVAGDGFGLSGDAAAQEYTVMPPRDLANVKLATYRSIGAQPVTVNPKNSNVFLAAYGSRAFYALQGFCWVRTSTNAGRTWGAPKKLPMPEGDPHCDRSALAWAPDGSRVYAAYSYWNLDADGAGVAISSSTDNGLTWSSPKTVVHFHDSNVIGASVKLATPITENDANWLYIVIGENVYGNDGENYYFSRSDDWGNTWSPVDDILSHGEREGPTPPSIAGGPGGEVLISYSYVVCENPTCSTETHDIKVNYSSDRGAHFQEHIVAVPDAIGDTAVAFGGAGTAHIVYTPWYENTPAFGPYYVYSTKPPYTKWSKPMALNAESPAQYVASPALAVSACGSGTSVLHAVWLNSSSGKDSVQYTRKIAKTGQEWSPKLRLSETSITYGSTPAIAAGLGTAVAVWGRYYNQPARVSASRIAPGVSCP